MQKELYTRTYEYWLAQNTGWSGRVSWFDDGKRYTSKDAALAANTAQKKKYGTKYIDYRVSKRVVTESYYYDADNQQLDGDS